jgi:AcrR family transcriptional regulator
MIRDRYPISQVVARTGTPAPTIHHYVRLGLLPAPHRAARNRFLYDERHVEGLRLIHALRTRRRLPLATIRRILPGLLRLTGEEGFRPEVWDRALDLRARRSRREPSARLLDSAVEAFSRRGYGDVNVDDICRAARIAKGSFYRHHRSKEELFFVVADTARAEVLAAFHRTMPPDPVATAAQLEERAAGILARSMEPRLAIFLDLFARASQRRTGYQEVAARMIGDIVGRVGAVVNPEDPEAAGMLVLQRALGTLLGHVLFSSPAGGTPETPQNPVAPPAAPPEAPPASG